MASTVIKLSQARRTHKSSGRERQASIIAAAATLFAQKGFNGTTTREIAKTAGISEALLYRYFPTKRALYAAIIAAKSQLSQLMASIEEAAAKRDDVQVFTLIAGFRIHRGADPSLLRLLLFSALEGHELSDMFFRNRHRVFYEFLAGYIARRTREGAFRKVDPLLAAQSFVGMIVYHRLLHEIFKVPPHCTPEEAVAGYVNVFLEGLRK
ncbi:MAG: TetR/AcrR family transcriptional regulator [Nitrospirae bacterium]|nr:MAG: TetR/AcrR family transcriptional regulator [Nitrospirota bacterium]